MYMTANIGVRDQFRSGGWGLPPEYFLHRLPENQVVLLEYYLLFCLKIAIWKILDGLQPPEPSRPVYAYDCQVYEHRHKEFYLQHNNVSPLKKLGVSRCSPGMH